MNADDNQRRTIEDVHLERLESYMDQWRLEDRNLTEVDGYGDEVADRMIVEAVDNGRLMRQIARLQGGLSDMREMAADWIRKPSVCLPVFAAGAASLFYLANQQMSVDDLNYMLDMAAISQVEFAEQTEALVGGKEKAKQLMAGIAGLGGSTALAMNLDRLLAYATGKGGHHRRLEAGADIDGDRLYSRLTDEETDEVKSLLHALRRLAQTGAPADGRELMDALLENVNRNERLMASGVASSDSLMERLSGLRERIEAIQEYLESHGRTSRHLLDSSPGVRMGSPTT